MASCYHRSGACWRQAGIWLRASPELRHLVLYHNFLIYKMRMACRFFLVSLIVFSVNRDKGIESARLSMTEAGLEALF